MTVTVNKTNETARNLNETLTSKYVSRPEDLKRAQEEKEWMINMAQKFNRKYDPPEDSGQNDDNEVVVYGNDNLSEDERALFNVEPGFMVVLSLSMQEMQVEAAVTFMKVRWSRRKAGVDHVTQEQQDKDSEFVELT